jgi:hypothetical protein
MWFISNNNLWERLRQTPTFGKGCAKHQPLGKVAPNTNLWERLRQTLLEKVSQNIKQIYSKKIRAGFKRLA